MKDLYTENSKSLKEIENDRTGKIDHIHESEEVNLKWWYYLSIDSVQPQ